MDEQNLQASHSPPNPELRWQRGGVPEGLRGYSGCWLAGWGLSRSRRANPPLRGPQRVEADWVLAERVALLSTAAEAVTTQADAAGGCDGVKNGEWGFHTGESQAPWWQVDLGETQPIARVTIWNRTAAAERARQIRVLLLEDGRTFRQVYQHDGTVFYGFRRRQASGC